MYENFSDRARHVMQLANQEANRFNYEYIGTEHVLLGLIEEGARVGDTALSEMGVDPEKVRRRVRELIQPGPDMTPTGTLPQVPRLKRVIEYAMHEASALNDSHVDPKHLLLGLLREAEGVVAQVLGELGLTRDRADREIKYLWSRVMDDLGCPVEEIPAVCKELGRGLGFKLLTSLVHTVMDYRKHNPDLKEL